MRSEAIASSTNSPKLILLRLRKCFRCFVRYAKLNGFRAGNHRLIYSDSGVAELGCVFTTPSPPGSAAPDRASAETSWIVTDYDAAAFRIHYLWIDPGHIITELRIQLARSGEQGTRTHIRYRYTGLSPKGNSDLEHYDQKWFQSKMQNWETTINYYLRTGKKMVA